MLARAGIAVAGLLAIVLAQRLAADPALPFLWPYAPAGWIVAPWQTQLRARPVQPTALVFSRNFDLDTPPASARLHLRAFRAADVRINGQHVVTTRLGDDWKQKVDADVARLLRAGENTLSVQVENTAGPPALWLALDLPGTPLLTDEQWRVETLRGEQQAVYATRAPLRPAGAPVPAQTRLDLARTARSATPDLLLFAALVALCAIAVRSESRGAAPSAERPQGESPRAPRMVLFACIAAWCVLLAGTSRVLLITTGFDAEGHLEYVELVRTTHTLPLADRGWETYHPPLYYVLQAALLGVAGVGAFDGPGALLMRLVHLALGIVYLTSVAASLGLLFPAAPRPKILGMLVAAFLPVLLYVFQFPSNEVLAIALGAVCFHACLRVVCDGASGFGRELLLGIALGAALLTKQSALLLVPVMILVVAWSALIRSDGGPRRAVAASGTVLAALILTAGWHYARVWARFGDPFVANWDGRATPAWWQDPGFRTPHDWIRVLGAIREPFFAASDGLVAGLYSSLWADSFAAGVVNAQLERPPWRSPLVALGPLLGVPLTLALVAGWIATARVTIAKRDPARALAPALVACAVLAALWMGLVVPFGSIAKASYLMVVATPLAVLAAVGLDGLAGRARWRSALVLGYVVGWAALSFATYSLAFVPGEPR